MGAVQAVREEAIGAVQAVRVEAMGAVQAVRKKWGWSQPRNSQPRSRLGEEAMVRFLSRVGGWEERSRLEVEVFLLDRHDVHTLDLRGAPGELISE